MGKVRTGMTYRLQFLLQLTSEPTGLYQFIDPDQALARQQRPSVPRRKVTVVDSVLIHKVLCSFGLLLHLLEVAHSFLKCGIVF